MDSEQARIQILFSAKKFDICYSLLTKCLDKSRLKKLSPLESVILLDQRAACSEKLGYISRAIKDGIQMIKILPTCSRGYLRLGKLYQLQCDYQSARKAYSVGLKRIPLSDENRQVVKVLYNGAKRDELFWSCRKDPVSTLPFEVLHVIFRDLPLDTLARCQLVSRSWRMYILENVSLWSDKFTTSRSTKKLLTPKILESYLRLAAGSTRSRSVGTVSIDNISRGKEFACLSLLSKYRSCINELKIILSTDLDAIKKLDHVILRDEISFQGIQSFCITTGSTFRCAIAISQNNKSIKELQWDYCFANGGPEFNTEILQEFPIPNKITSLEILRLSSNRLEPGIVTVDSSYSYRNSLNENGFIHSFPACVYSWTCQLIDLSPSLVELSISGFLPRFDFYENLQNLIDKLQNLEVLKLEGITSTRLSITLLPLLQSTRLRVLQLSYFNILEGTNSIGFHSLPNLEILRLHYCNIIGSNNNNHGSTHNLRFNSPNLRELSLKQSSICNSLKSHETYNRIIGQKFPKLIILCVSGATEISDKIIDSILQSSESLELVDLRGTQVTGEGFARLVLAGIKILGLDTTEVSLETLQWLEKRNVEILS